MEKNETIKFLVKIRDEFLELLNENRKSSTMSIEEAESIQYEINKLESMSEKDFEYIESKLYEQFENIMNE